MAGLMHLKLLRVARVLRLLKLLRVARVGRLADWACTHIGVAFKTLAVIRFLFIFVVVLHWTACAARMLADGCEGQAGRCASGPVITFGKGTTTEYFSALHLSLIHI